MFLKAESKAIAATANATYPKTEKIGLTVLIANALSACIVEFELLLAST